jgi:hypothetical protein
MSVHSDHCPILLSLEEQSRQPQRRKEEKIFRYEIMWESHENFVSALDNAWKEHGKATTLVELQEKLVVVTGVLQN